MSDLNTEHRHERRRFVRVDVYAVTRYFCPLRDKEIGVQTRLSDISEGGAMLLTFEEGIPIDTEVSIDFVLPDDSKGIVSAKGKVRHTGPVESNMFRSGVEFLKLHSKSHQAIKNYVSRKLHR